MTTEDFDRILSARLTSIQATLGRKAKEYACGGDRLHNFKTAARMAGTSPAQALWGMAAKHLVSVDDLVQGRLPNLAPLVEEKIGDLANYLVLLEAVLEEERADHLLQHPAPLSRVVMRTCRSMP
jgi:hypothetical protein